MDLLLELNQFTFFLFNIYVFRYSIIDRVSALKRLADGFVMCPSFAETIFEVYFTFHYKKVALCNWCVKRFFFFFNFVNNLIDIRLSINRRAKII